MGKRIHYSSELIIANKELAYQNLEKEKRATELIIANKELAYQNSEKEKRATELIIANKELAYQNSEKEKRATELIIANKELAYQNCEKEKRAIELIIANKELKKAKLYQKEYLRGLKQMMFMISHKVRQPITQIMGISNLLETPMHSQEDLRTITGYIKHSIGELDIFTKDLTTLMYELNQKKHSS